MELPSFSPIGGIDFAILWGVLIYPLHWSSSSLYSTHNACAVQVWANGALGVIVVIVVIDTLAENVVFPSLAGKGLKLSPASLFLALIYWNYVLGTAGVILSIPLTIVLKFLLESFEDTKWLA